MTVVPCPAGFQPVFSQTWLLQGPADSNDLVMRWNVSGGFPMADSFIRPWLDKRIGIVGYELMQMSPHAHVWWMIGNNIIGDPKLWISPTENIKRVFYPHGYCDPVPKKTEAATTDYIDVHGAALGGGTVQMWLTLHYIEFPL